jgi:hypothetical protein
MHCTHHRFERRAESDCLSVLEPRRISAAIDPASLLHELDSPFSRSSLRLTRNNRLVSGRLGLFLRGSVDGDFSSTYGAPEPQT